MSELQQNEEQKREINVDERFLLERESDVIFVPAEKRRHIYSGPSVADVMFDIAQRRYLETPNAYNRLELCVAAGWGMGVPANFSCGLDDARMKLPETSSLLFSGRRMVLSDDESSLVEVDIDVTIPFSMIARLKIHVLREYAARKIMDGGDKSEADVGRMDHPDFGRVLSLADFTAAQEAKKPFECPPET